MTTELEIEAKKILEEEEMKRISEEKIYQRTDPKLMMNQLRRIQFKEIKRQLTNQTQDLLRKNLESHKHLNIIEFIFVTLNRIGFTKEIQMSYSKKFSSSIKMIRDSERCQSNLFIVQCFS
jgi:hypothetical protein